TVEDGGQVLAEPAVSLGDRAVVHIVDHVRGDKGKCGQRVGGEIVRQLGAVGNVKADFRAVSDGSVRLTEGQGPVVGGRVMAHRVVTGVPAGAIRRHGLFIRFPTLTLSKN